MSKDDEELNQLPGAVNQPVDATIINVPAESKTPASATSLPSTPKPSTPSKPSTPKPSTPKPSTPAIVPPIEHAQIVHIAPMVDSRPTSPTKVTPIMPDDSVHSIAERLSSKPSLSFGIHRPMTAAKRASVTTETLEMIRSSLASKTSLSDLVVDAQWTTLKETMEGLTPSARKAFFHSVHNDAKLKLVPLLSSAEFDEYKDKLKVANDSLVLHIEPAYSTLICYPEWTVGDYRREFLAKRKLGSLGSHGPVWVVDPSTNYILGFVDLPSMAVADAKESIGAKMQSLNNTDSAQVHKNDSQSKWLDIVRSWDSNRKLRAVPVTTEDGFFIGMVIDRELLKIADEEHSRTSQLQTGVLPHFTPYLKTPFWLLIWKRVFWLLVLVGIEIGAGSVISAYDYVLADQIVLAFFIPVVIATGGNAGTQAAVVLVQAFAEGSLDTSLKDFFIALYTEAVVATVDGVVLAATIFGLGYWKGGLPIAYVTSLSMFTVVLMADFLGLLLPYAFKWLHIDPAVATSSLITSTLDVAGLSILFAYATRILVLK